MNKKIAAFLLIIVSLFALWACKPVTEDLVTLPNLSGMTRAEAINVLFSYDINFSFADETNNDVAEGLFSSYSDGLNAGSKVEPGTTVVVYFAVHRTLLPNLTGRTQSQVLSALIALKLIVNVDYYETNDIAEGLFSHYGGNYEAGSAVNEGQEITVYIATPLIIVNRGLIISKYLEGSGQNRALELFNATNSPIDLSKYKIDIYSNGSETVSLTVELEGTLEPGEVYVVSHPLSSAEIRAKADLLAENLIFDGNDAVALTYFNDVIVDIFGNIGWGLFYIANETYVRKAYVNEGADLFEVNEWFIYVMDNHSVIGEHPIEFPTEFTFTAEQLAVPYEESGGFIEVTLHYNVDGDTAAFLPGFTGQQRVRFVGIQTPETGQYLYSEASQFTASLLNNATTIHLQNDPSSGRTDTYGRSLALVWADGVLVNYKVVLNGYSQNNYQDINYHLVFDGVSLTRWMIFAENHARENRLGLWA